jgi:hypothetical protein
MVNFDQYLEKFLDSPVFGLFVAIVSGIRTEQTPFQEGVLMETHTALILSFFWDQIHFAGRFLVLP